MKYYKSYTAKKFKMPRRIVFFALIAVLIFVAAVITGNILKRRVDNNDIDTTPVTEPVTDTSKNEGGEEESVTHDTVLSGVNAAFLDLSTAKDAQGARAAVRKVYDGGYNAVLFKAYDDAVMLKYASPAAQSASGITASDALVPYSVLREAAGAAYSYGLRCVAAVHKDIKLLPEVAYELADAGFDEILLLGFEGVESLSTNSTDEIVQCISSLRKGSVCVGVCLGADIYLGAQNSPYIEKLYKKAEYLAIDMTGFGADSAADMAKKIQGSFSAYMLRPVLDGSNAEGAAAVKAALTSSGVSSCAYISAPPVSDKEAEKAEG